MGLAAGAQGGQEEGDEAQVEEEEEGPLLREVLHVHTGEDEIGGDAQHRSRRLDDDPAELEVHAAVVGGACDEDDAEGRSHEAQAQEHHVRLSEDISDCVQQSGENGHSTTSQKFYL